MAEYTGILVHLQRIQGIDSNFGTALKSNQSGIHNEQYLPNLFWKRSNMEYNGIKEIIFQSHYIFVLEATLNLPTPNRTGQIKHK